MLTGLPVGLLDRRSFAARRVVGEEPRNSTVLKATLHSGPSHKIQVMCLHIRQSTWSDVRYTYPSDSWDNQHRHPRRRLCSKNTSTLLVQSTRRVTLEDRASQVAAPHARNGLKRQLCDATSLQGSQWNVETSHFIYIISTFLVPHFLSTLYCAPYRYLYSAFYAKCFCTKGHHNHNHVIIIIITQRFHFSWIASLKNSLAGDLPQ